jgi:acyl carrier protein
MLEQVKKVLASALNIDVVNVDENSSLKEDLGIDSLAAVELAMELESTFDIRIEDDELTGLKTVGDIVALLNQKQ